MKLTVKSLQGGNFSLDAQPTDTIGSVKAKIATEKGHPPETQKIIYSGKILTDEQTVQDCNVTEKGFLVLMVSKPKAPKAAEVPASASAATPVADPASSSSITTTETPTAPAPTPLEGSSITTPAPVVSETTTPAAAVPDAPAASATSATSAPADPSFVTGSHLESVVQNMVEMGFERDQVQRALRASYNNPDRAVEYLMNGIPEHIQQQQRPASTAAASPAAAAAAVAGTATTGSTTGGGAATAPTPSAASQRPGNLFEAAAAAAQGGGAGRGAAGVNPAGAGGAGLGDEDEDSTTLDLSNPAMIAQLQQLVRENPAALQPLIHAIAQSNPQLAAALQADPQGVLSLLSGAATGGGLGGLEGEGEGEEVQLPTMDQLAPEDRTAVEQIVAMGIPDEKAIEAYLMCGRNVEMAIQFYFENENEDFFG